MNVLLIIPAYNEEKSILTTIENVETFQAKGFELDYLVVNDGSSDQTLQLLKENNKNVLSLVHNLGIGGSVQSGYKYAFENDYDIAVQFDGDGQHDINSLPDVIEPLLKEEADFSIGSRFVKKSDDNFQSSLMRQFGIKVISRFIKLTAGIKIYDVTSGYRAANKKIIKLLAENYPVRYPEPESTVYISKHGYSIKEVPANMFERKDGKSSISPINSIAYMIDVCLSILLLSFKKTNKKDDSSQTKID